MEIIFIVITAIFGSWLYLNHAPMHEIRQYIIMENMANQKHKYEDTEPAESNS